MFYFGFLSSYIPYLLIFLASFGYLGFNYIQKTNVFGNDDTQIKDKHEIIAVQEIHEDTPADFIPAFHKIYNKKSIRFSLNATKKKFAKRILFLKIPEERPTFSWSLPPPRTA